MIRRTFLKGAAAVSFSLMVSPALTAFAKDSVRVYLGGPIFTMNKNNEIVEAIAVKGETILAVGNKAEVMAAIGLGRRNAGTYAEEVVCDEVHLPDPVTGGQGARVGGSRVFNREKTG